MTDPFDAYKGKGLSGLGNLGNTCYVNACLQMLSHTYEFNEFLSKNGGEFKARLNHKVESVLLHEWDKLRAMLWSGNCIISPGGFVSSMQKIAKLKRMDLFSGFQQNDVAEFLGFLLDCFHTALAREVEMKVRGVARNATDRAAQQCYQMMASMYKKQYSEVLNIFYGVHVSIIEPLPSGATPNSVALSTKPEPFCILNVSIPPAKTPNAVVTLFDCLDHHCAPECPATAPIFPSTCTATIRRATCTTCSGCATTTAVRPWAAITPPPSGTQTAAGTRATTPR